MKHKKNILFIFDGGNAPGYMSIATALTEESVKHSLNVYACREGFRSLVSHTTENPGLIQLVWGEEDALALRQHKKTFPVMSLNRHIGDAGCAFRSERYRDFQLTKNVRQGADFILSQKIDILVGIGGNGTLKGIQSLAEHLPESLSIGFINCSVDSDVLNDRSVGFVTGMQEGSHIARGLFEDAFTHKRIYILEMMGNRSGKHALHAGASARAHLIILPNFELNASILKDMSSKLQKESYALVVVAEGYGHEERLRCGSSQNAAEYFKCQLEQHGLVDRPEKRIIAQPFGRHLRGVRPNPMDIEMAVLKSNILIQGLLCGNTRVMAYYLGEHNYGLRPFHEIKTDNEVEPIFLNLIDRFGITSFQQYIAKQFQHKLTLSS